MNTQTSSEWESKVHDLHRRMHHKRYAANRPSYPKPQIEPELPVLQPAEPEPSRPRTRLGITRLLILVGTVAGISYLLVHGEVAGRLIGQLPGFLNHLQSALVRAADWLMGQLPGSLDELQSMALRLIDWFMHQLPASLVPGQLFGPLGW